MCIPLIGPRVGGASPLDQRGVAAETSYRQLAPKGGRQDRAVVRLWGRLGVEPAVMVGGGFGGGKSPVGESQSGRDDFHGLFPPGALACWGSPKPVCVILPIVVRRCCSDRPTRTCPRLGGGLLASAVRRRCSPGLGGGGVVGVAVLRRATGRSGVYKGLIYLKKEV